MENTLIYGVKDKPGFGKTILFALQQLLAILAATIAVPAIIGHGMSQSAALFGAGVGTLVYLLFTKFKSPVFLGSSFAFLGSMAAAFAGAATTELGYLGLILGGILAGLVYVILAIVVKFTGTGWLKKLMPAVVIGPTVAIIGLSLAGNAIGDLSSGGLKITQIVDGNEILVSACSPYIAILCGLTTLVVVILCSVYGKKMMKMVPFIIGILTGYALAAIFTGIGYIANIDALKVIDFTKFTSIEWIPDFAFLKAFGGFKDFDFSYFGVVALAYIPVSFVVYTEHVAM